MPAEHARTDRTPALDDAVLVAVLLGLDPVGLGGVVLDHPAHDAVRRWSHLLQELLPGPAPLRRVPIGISADRLIGGVDLAMTLSTGRLVAERGVLSAADGGVVVVPMAERLTTAVRTTLGEALDTQAVQVAREGIAERQAARVAVVLMDESTEDEAVHDSLRDRLAFRVAGLDAMPPHDVERLRAGVAEARHRLSMVTIDDRWYEGLCAAAAMFGVDSARAAIAAVRCARAHAAWSGRLLVHDEDAEVAARLVLAPRATRVPPPPPSDEPPPEAPPEPPPEAQHPDDPPPPEADGDDSQSKLPDATTELMRDAVLAALPPGLLAQLLARAEQGGAQGRVGDEQVSLLRGRPRGARHGLPRGGARLHLLETLRAAAPWQRVRGRTDRVAIRRDDFRIRRFVEKTGTTVFFVVDASGSAALQRLSEAKGAIEVLLAESYARRDRVALLAFRGTSTEVLLPPTRALARAKRVLAALPGGGGTPMAHAIDMAIEQALAARRGGTAPMVVFLTDGRANIARDGTPGRAAAERDAIASAEVFARLGVPCLFVDTSPRGEPVAKRLAAALRARYVFLPAADAKALGALVRTAMDVQAGGGA